MSFITSSAGKPSAGKVVFIEMKDSEINDGFNAVVFQLREPLRLGLFATIELIRHLMEIGQTICFNRLCPYVLL